ncbi:MAG: ornithine carbamoyltransferase [Candidatus Odinarchaeota archaeon]
MVVTEDLIGRDYLSMADFNREEIETFLTVGMDLKRRFTMREDHRNILPGRTLFMVFYNDSLRTRNSFEAGMTQLGGHAHFLQPGAIYTPALPGDEVAYSTERVSDVSRVLSRMGDAIAIRIYGNKCGWIYGKGHKLMENFAYWSKKPVINMEDDIYHPCQGLADVMTMYEKFGHSFNNLQGKKYVMSWAYSPSTQKPMAVPQTGVIAPAIFGMDVTLACPPEMELHPDIYKKVEELSDLHGGTFEVVHDMKEAFEGADVVYPKAWGCLGAHGIEGQREPNPEVSNKAFEANKHWICTQEMMDLTNKGRGYYMHCLPADRSYEVTDEVIDGPNSIVFDQAENRLHAQKGVMACIMK